MKFPKKGPEKYENRNFFEKYFANQKMFHHSFLVGFQEVERSEKFLICLSQLKSKVDFWTNKEFTNSIDRENFNPLTPRRIQVSPFTKISILF